MEQTVSITVRSIVGLILAYAVAFLGMITGTLMIPPINEVDITPLLSRVGLIALGAALGSIGAWFNYLVDRKKMTLLIFVAFVGAFAAGMISYYWSDAFTGYADRYIRIREVTQSTVVGAAIGANVLAAIFGILVPDSWRN